MNRLPQFVVALTYLSIGFLLAGLSTPKAFGSTWIYVLDDIEDTVTAISHDGVTNWEARLKGNPERMVISAGGGHLIALEKGDGAMSRRYGWVPEKMSSINLVDTESSKVTLLRNVCWSASVGAVERGEGIGGAWYLSPDGRRIVIYCEGRWARKRGNGKIFPLAKPDSPELLEIDLTTGAVARRVSIDRKVMGWVNLPNGRGFAILLSFQEKPLRKAEVRFIDGQTLETESVLQVEGKPRALFMSVDQRVIYLFDQGTPTKKVKTNVHGVLSVIDTASRQLSNTIDLGTAPRIGVDLENKQLLFASTVGPNASGKKQDTGVVRLVAKGELVGRFEVGREALGVMSFPDHGRLYTVGTKAFTVTDTNTGTSQKFKYPMNFGAFGQMIVNKEHTRAFLLAAPDPNLGYYLLVIDLDDLTMAGLFSVGSMGKRIGKMFGAAVLAAGFSSMLPGPQSLSDIGTTAARNAMSQSMIVDLSMLVARGGIYGGICFGPGEEHVYAINYASRDVTVFDAVNPGEGAVIPDSGGARHMRLTPQSGQLAVLTGDEGLMLIDTSSTAVVTKRKFGGNFIGLGANEEVIALSRETHSVYRLGAAELDVINRVGEIKSPYQFLLHPNL